MTITISMPMLVNATFTACLLGLDDDDDDDDNDDDDDDDDVEDDHDNHDGDDCIVWH